MGQLPTFRNAFARASCRHPDYRSHFLNARSSCQPEAEPTRCCRHGDRPRRCVCHRAAQAERPCRGRTQRESVRATRPPKKVRVQRAARSPSPSPCRACCRQRDGEVHDYRRHRDVSRRRRRLHQAAERHAELLRSASSRRPSPCSSSRTTIPEANETLHAHAVRRDERVDRRPDRNRHDPNDDVTFGVLDTSVTEGDTGTTTRTCKSRLSNASDVTTTVRFSTTPARLHGNGRRRLHPDYESDTDVRRGRDRQDGAGPGQGR